MTAKYHDEIHVALGAVLGAMSICRSVRDRLVTADTLTKKDKSPVTVADFASQAVICSHLSHAFPDDPIVGEETAQDLRSQEQAALRIAVLGAARESLEGASDAEILGFIDRGGADGSTDRYWTLDPIDGTKGFLRGEQYAVALALIENHQVVLGVLGCPNVETQGRLGTVFFAVRDQGSFMLSKLEFETDQVAVPRIHTSGSADASQARFCESVESGHSDQSLSQRIATDLGITSPPLRMDSQVKYGILARGDASIYLRLPTRSDYHEKIWDHAAGMIIVEEAGGKVTDITGEPLDFSHGRTLTANRGVVATNGLIHDRVISAVQGAMGA